MRDLHNDGVLGGLLKAAGQALVVLAAPTQPTRPSPAGRLKDTVEDPAQTAAVAGMMRINHAGEVCAQALYFGHAAAARTEKVRADMLQAADEEADHLAWCAQRLDELGARPSLLNPLWYAGAYTLGVVSARFGDPIALGFVAETERQVESHLTDHLQRLPADDARSRAIVEQMRSDEIAHGQAALRAGGRPLPWPVPQLMRRAADVLRAIAYRL